MKKVNRFCARTLLLAVVAALSAALPVLAQNEPTIDKTSVQVTTQEHRVSYANGQEDRSLWSWTPRIEFRVNGPVASGSQLQVEYTLPGGKSWMRVDCETGEVGLGTKRIVMPVQALGAEDGEWDKTAWKTTAFYGNPLSGFTAP